MTTPEREVTIRIIVITVAALVLILGVCCCTSMTLMSIFGTTG